MHTLFPASPYNTCCATGCFAQGGSTGFPTLEVEALPAKGRVLVFYDCEPGSYARALHWTLLLAVLESTKFISDDHQQRHRAVTTLVE